MTMRPAARCAAILASVFVGSRALAQSDAPANTAPSAPWGSSSGAAPASDAPPTEEFRLPDGTSFRAQVLERRVDGTLLVRLVTGELRIVFSRTLPAAQPAQPAEPMLYFAPAVEAPRPVAVLPFPGYASETTPGVPGTVPVTITSTDPEPYRVGFPLGQYQENWSTHSIIVRVRREVCQSPCTLYLPPGRHRLWIALHHYPNLMFMNSLESTIVVGDRPARYTIDEGRPGAAVAASFVASFGMMGLALGTVLAIMGVASNQQTQTVGGAIAGSSGAVVMLVGLVGWFKWGPRLREQGARGEARRRRNGSFALGASPGPEGGALTATITF